MSLKISGPLFRHVVVAGLLAGTLQPLAGAPPAAAAEVKAPQLVEAFLKGPVSMSAKVIRGAGKPEETSLPLFQVPVLDYQDQLELSFKGEAFDQRVTGADWSLVVVFLPRTIAPTDQGVVSLRLKHKNDRMVVPTLTAPYDSVPMLFLIPDKNGRKKVLKDLNAHLGAFRTLCAKIADLSAERAAVDKFIEDLEGIDKNLSAPQYDNAVLGFLHTYGTGISVDAQAFLATGQSNLDKCQFLTQEIQKTSVFVPSDAATAPAQASVAVGGGWHSSAYVSIFFDVATIIANLWPGHQFQYLPALARNFHGDEAELYYTDWIHTTGDTLGALMCCPGKWEEQKPPSFDLILPPGESLLGKQSLLKVLPREPDRRPFSLFGHDWKLLVAGPKGESLPPLTLAVSPKKDAFVAVPAPLLDPLAKLDATRVKARVVGRWGFTSIASGTVEIPVGLDAAWQPSAKEKAAFQVGKACTFELPAAWAPIVEKVVFRPSAKDAEPLVAKLKDREVGTKEARFEPKADSAGPGTLEIHTFGKPVLARALTLLAAEPEASSVEARLHDATLVLRGHRLNGVEAVLLGGRRFVPVDKGDGDALTLKPEDGKPFEGAPGRKLEATLITQGGAKTPLDPVALLPARPRLEEAQVVPMAVKGSGLPLTSALPVAPTSAPSQVSVIAAKGYRFAADGAFHAVLRNAEDPGEVRPIPSAKIRVTGNNQKATFAFIPSDLLGGRASGRLELQISDDHCGASDWMALPATFLDLPVIVAVQATATEARLIGPSLEPIEAIALAPGGPWEKVGVAIEEGHEAIKVASPLAAKTCYLKLFGWPEFVLALALPPPAATRPSPAAQNPQPAPGPEKKAEPAPKAPAPNPVTAAGDPPAVPKV